MVQSFVMGLAEGELRLLASGL